MSYRPYIGLLLVSVIPLAACKDKGTTDASNVLSVTCTASPESGNAPLIVNFSANASGADGDVRYSWSFGDGSRALGQQVRRTYESGGTYLVTVTARAGTDEGQCQRTVVVGSPIRIDRCNAVPKIGYPPLEVQFTADVKGGTGTYTYSWDFNDGANSSEAEPQHTYTQTGEYVVRLTVQSGDHSAMCSVPVNAYNRMNVTCSASPTSGDVPLAVDFSASPGGGGYSYEWDFGDGHTSTERNPHHVFKINGGFRPEVIVIGNGNMGICRTALITTTGGSAGGGGGVPGGGPGTGDLAFRLSWSTTADLDLYVREPSGDVIFYGAPTSASGGQLDVDANAGCVTADPSPIENIFWPTGTAPSGSYEYWVHHYGCGPSSSFTLNVYRGGSIVETQTGSLNPNEEGTHYPYTY